MYQLMDGTMDIHVHASINGWSNCTCTLYVLMDEILDGSMDESMDGTMDGTCTCIN